MDDQKDKKSYEKSYDDFFRDKDDSLGEQENNRSSAIDNTSNANDNNGDSSPAKSTYYYSYGPYKSDRLQDASPAGMGASQADNSQTNDAANPYSNTGSQPIDAPTGENTPNNAHPQQIQSSYSPLHTAGVQPQSPYGQQQQANAPTQLRPFTTSSNGEKGGWAAAKKEPRKTSFKSIFAAFMVGVISVAALMYAADTQNWFTKGQAVVSQSQQGSSSNTGNSGSKEYTNSGSSAGNAVVANRPDNIAQLFESASPAVVKIETYQKVSRNSGNSIFDDPFFRQFFGDGGRSGQSQQQQEQEDDSDANMQQSGIGTGFFFEESGYILTNQHVVSDSDLINVTVQGFDEPFKAELLGNSFELDLAVLKITGEQPFPTLPLGSSDDINIGDWVIAIGNPYGFDHTVTVGVISAKERPIEIQDTDGTRSYEHLLQTDASINPGNSGGPLLNVNGEVVGINTAVSSQAQGIGFAIPTSTIQSVIESLVANEEIPKEPIPFIGANLVNVNESYAQQLGLDKIEGSLVRDVYYNSPAYLGDLKQYDVIVGIDGKSYSTMEKLIAEIKSRKVGDIVVMNIIRKGEKMDLNIELGDKNEFVTE